MSIEDLSTEVTYDGDGVTTSFPYTFPILEASDIQVIITDQFGTETILTSNYQVDTINAEILYPTTGSPLAGDGSAITLRRVLPLTQETILTNTGPLPAVVLETAYDKLTMICQQLQAEIDDLTARVVILEEGGGGAGGGTAEPVYADDIVLTGAGGGVILTSPDNALLIRVAVSDRTAISNDESITTESVASYEGLYNINPGKGIVFTTPDGSKKYRVSVNNAGELISGIAGTYTFDITITAPGKGLVCVTPNGLHTVRIAIDNDGEITTEELS